MKHKTRAELITMIEGLCKEARMRETLIDKFRKEIGENDKEKIALMEQIRELKKGKATRTAVRLDAVAMTQILLDSLTLGGKVRKEVRVADSIADVMVLAAWRISIFEIKSDHDSLQKLAKQIRDYQKVSPRVHVVVGKKHLREAIRTLAGTGVGVVECHSDGLQTHLPMMENHDHLETEALFKLLRKGEYMEWARCQGVDLSLLPNTETFTRAFRQARKVNVKDFYIDVARILAERCENG